MDKICLREVLSTLFPWTAELTRGKGKVGQYFEGVPSEVWDFHIGGYQVCEKWLKDHRGRKLTYNERIHYQEIIVALKETIRLMAEIDAEIPSWPLQ